MTAATRRALLGAIIAVPAVACASAPGSSPDAILAGKLAHRQRTQAAWDAYYDGTFTPMEEALYDDLKAIPHRQGELSFVNGLDMDQHYSTEPWSVGDARLAIENAAYCRPDQLAAAREIVDLAEQRSAAVTEAEVRHNEDAVRARESELMSADSDAIRSILAHEVTTTADLLVKLRLIIDADVWEMDEACAGVAADLVRLRKMGAA